jgi:hypothetical protein
MINGALRPNVAAANAPGLAQHEARGEGLALLGLADGGAAGEAWI